ncbi:ferric reductase-like transmembrane domain-containing protein [Sulfurovum sp. zt1-1]|uniref:Ferric reductase-like transmembrane domain-containing protein n=1 Tax=Sulfurovum zhangzhouensis TaxID=3019067 RepID=A0ABT7QXR9_9BACT|nr:ferric reductase-like transmembrane domain-containing protein [Sulfurovum zhangzhouensis]MDM5271615.1 ferric reductase-like transmembrane domain-containing protein [Sulfurovum zhangzhouensis]
MRQLILSFILLQPLLFLLYMLFISGVEDPIKFIYTLTGATALTLLYITTTLSLLRRSINLLRYRRTVGLFSFFYALLHLLNFLILDMELDLVSALNETFDKPFIFFGMASFLILLFMAITSHRSLFPRYFKYHKMIYIVILLSTIHFVMAQKALSIPQWGYLGVMALISILKVLQRSGIVKL